MNAIIPTRGHSGTGPARDLLWILAPTRQSVLENDELLVLYSMVQHHPVLSDKP